VTFEPSARTAWHTHPLGQTLIVTAGCGLVQSWGGPAKQIRPGDVIWFPPGEKHWHGAMPGVAMTHIAIVEGLEGKGADWMEKLSDEHYQAAAKSSEGLGSAMAISEQAQRNHDALFPNHISTLGATDPELIEVFDNWAFGEVLEDDVLGARTRLMVQLAAIIATQAVNEYRVMVGGALNVGVRPVEVKEIVYQAVPYLGMAKVFDFLHATNDVLEARGVKLPLERQSTTNPETRFEKGLEVQRRILGERIDEMHAASPEDELHIQRYLSANCFGDFYTRTGLDLKTRELLTLSMLAALGGCEPQLSSHVAANLAAGNDRRVLVGTLTQLLPFIGYPRTLNAIRIINDGTSA